LTYSQIWRTANLPPVCGESTDPAPGNFRKPLNYNDIFFVRQNGSEKKPSLDWELSAVEQRLSTELSTGR
jgi:hypothetical protein